ncbi:MAG: ParB/RepB/Spo0J family partition protein [Planctomycetota bacterium]
MKRSKRKKFHRLERVTVEYVPIDSIKPNEYNPNRQADREFQMLKKSIQADGFTQPVLVHRQTREIIDGEHRWHAAKELGYEEIPVIFTEMTREQMRIATLRHNRARGSEIPDLTAQVIEELEELGALEETKQELLLSDNEIDRMLEEQDAALAMAAEEFGEAWLPTVDGDKWRGDEGTDTDSEGSTDTARSMTGEAVRLNHQQDRKLKRAKSEEEKRAILRDTNIFRLTLTFAKEEWVRVQTVLGDRPAEKFMKYIQVEYEKIEAERKRKEAARKKKTRTTKKRRTTKS